MKIVNLQQREADWLEWRSQGITATDAVIILGRSPYKTPWRLWAEKTGYATPEDLSNNPNVRRGVEREKDARQAFEEKHDDLLLPVCVESSEMPLLRASLDGLRGNGEPVELKCPSETVWNEVCAEGTDSATYQMYYVQVMHQIACTGAAQGWLIFFFEGEIKEFLIARDDALIDEIRVAASAFWELIQARKEPEKDPERDVYLPRGEEVSLWIVAAEGYRFYEAEIQELKLRLGALQEQQKPLLDTMKSLMGDFYSADYAGVMVTRYKAAGTVDYRKALAARLPDITPEELEQYRGKSSERCRVTVTDSVKPRRIVDEAVIAPLEGLPEQVESFYW